MNPPAIPTTLTIIVVMPSSATFCTDAALRSCLNNSDTYCFARGVMRAGDCSDVNNDICIAKLQTCRNYMPINDINADNIRGKACACNISARAGTSITLNTAEGETTTITDFYSQQIVISPRLVDSIQINSEDKAYDTAQYTTVISPEYTTNQGVVWSVDDDSVAKISQNGLLTAKKNGTVTITATSADGNATATKQVEVHAYATINNIVSDIGEWDKAFQPNIRQYTVTVPPSTSQISFTATANIGAIYGNDNLMLSGLPQPFNLTGDSTEIEIAIKGVTDFDDGVYTVRVLKEVQSELIPLDEYKDKVSIQKTETIDTITLVIEPLADIDLSNMRLYVAEYDSGVLSSVWCGENSMVDDKLVVIADKPVAAEYKIILWDKMCPVIGVIGE